MEIRAFDNGGETIDRYTIIIDQSVYTMSDQPTHPQGVSQFMGTLDQLTSPDTWKGEVSIADLPEAIRLAILDRICGS